MCVVKYHHAALPKFVSYLSADASPQGEDNPQPFSPKMVTEKTLTYNLGPHSRRAPLLWKRGAPISAGRERVLRGEQHPLASWRGPTDWCACETSRAWYCAAPGSLYATSQLQIHASAPCPGTLIWTYGKFNPGKPTFKGGLEKILGLSNILEKVKMSFTPKEQCFHETSWQNKNYNLTNARFSKMASGFARLKTRSI